MGEEGTGEKGWDRVEGEGQGKVSEYSHKYLTTHSTQLTLSVAALMHLHCTVNSAVSLTLPMLFMASQV